MNPNFCLSTLRKLSVAFRRGFASDWSTSTKLLFLFSYTRLAGRKLFFREDKVNNSFVFIRYNIFFYTYYTLDLLIDEIFLRQVYLFESDRPDPLIIDCGSNIGMSVLFFKLYYPKSRIIAFEPDPHTFSLLEKNVAGNGLLNVRTLNLAVSDRDGFVNLYVGNGNESLTMSMLQERGGKTKKEVECTRLSRYITETVDFLKIDIEGAELSVLNELDEQRCLQYVKQMAIEFHHHITTERDCLSDVLRLLEINGFGYQVEASLPRPLKGCQPQDIIIYAYQKSIGNAHGSGANVAEVQPNVLTMDLGDTSNSRDGSPGCQIFRP